MGKKTEQQIIAEAIVPPAAPSPFYKSEYDTAPHQYVSPRERKITPSEAKVRAVAYALKASHPTALKHAAKAMAEHIQDGSVLVPIPSSSGDTKANAALAKEISKHKKVQIVDALQRQAPVTPSHQLRRAGMPVPAGHHQFTVNPHLEGKLASENIVMIDNVITSGATMEAGRKALGANAKGIAFAKAKEVLSH